MDGRGTASPIETQHIATMTAVIDIQLQPGAGRMLKKVVAAIVRVPCSRLSGRLSWAMSPWRFGLVLPERVVRLISERERKLRRG